MRHISQLCNDIQLKADLFSRILFCPLACPSGVLVTILMCADSLPSGHAMSELAMILLDYISLETGNREHN